MNPDIWIEGGGIDAFTPEGVREWLKTAEVPPCTLVDLRPPLAFIQGHIAGSLSISYRTGTFADALSARVAPHTRVVTGGPDAWKAQQAAADAMTASLEVRGYVSAPWPAGAAAVADRLRSAVLIDTATLHRLQTEGGVQLLDVRNPTERQWGIIDGSRLVPLAEIGNVATSLHASQPVATYCNTGSKAIEAAVRLMEAGLTHVYVVARGGDGEWHGHGYPLSPS